MRARCIRQLAAIDADDAADAAALDAIADWCDRYTPLVGLDPPDGLLLDITGCAHLFGGEESLRRDLVRRLAAQGFHTRAAIADTSGWAWAVARYGVTTSVGRTSHRLALHSRGRAALGMRLPPRRARASIRRSPHLWRRPD